MTSPTRESPELSRRQRLLADAPWTWLRQVHGHRVVVVEHPGDCRAEEADAAVTACAGAALVVLTADCAPVGLASPEGIVGVVHAGWRGLMAGRRGGDGRDDEVARCQRGVGGARAVHRAARLQVLRARPRACRRALRPAVWWRLTRTVSRRSTCRRRCERRLSAPSATLVGRRPHLHPLLARPLVVEGERRQGPPGHRGLGARGRARSRPDGR